MSGLAFPSSPFSKVCGAPRWRDHLTRGPMLSSGWLREKLQAWCCRHSPLLRPDFSIQKLEPKILKNDQLGFVFSFWTKRRCQSLTEQFIKYHLIPQVFHQPILCSLAARCGGWREAAPAPSLSFIGQRVPKDSLVLNNLLLLNTLFPCLSFQ